MAPIKIFIVEDDELYGEMLKYHLSLNPGNEVFLYNKGSDCLKNLYKNPDVISLDYGLPDLSGHDVLKKIHEHNLKMPVIIVSGQEDVSTAVQLLREGAYDYFVKDDETKDRLWNIINKIKENIELKDEIDYLKQEIGKKYEFRKIIKGNSAPLNKIFELIEKAAQSNISVSITGDTGTGKELVAKAIHYNSSRNKYKFVPINVSAIPKELIESEMFGYEKGAFTGAIARKIGKFELAHKGTIFLDEIADMDQNMQTKLLRVLQENELTRVGGNEIVRFNSRLIVATNKNLAEEVKHGNFREDLYYRILGLPIHIPPLRDRGNDILVLAKFFINEFSKENNIQLLKLSQAAQEKLMKYSFPGNVRELKAIMELASVLTNSDIIDENEISFSTTNAARDFLLEDNTLQGYTNEIIKYYLDKYSDNVLEVAKRLDIGKSTIYRMKKNKEI